MGSEVGDVLDEMEVYANGHPDFMGDQAHFPDADEALLVIIERARAAYAREHTPEHAAFVAACMALGQAKAQCNDRPLYADEPIHARYDAVDLAMGDFMRTYRALAAQKERTDE